MFRSSPTPRLLATLLRGLACTLACATPGTRPGPGPDAAAPPAVAAQPRSAGPAAPGAEAASGAPAPAPSTQPAPPTPVEPPPQAAPPQAPPPPPPREPRLFVYRALAAALGRYEELAAQPWPGPLPGPVAPARSVSPGDSWSGLPVLARRLHLLGDLTADPEAACAGGRYGKTLVAAVKRFQGRHGLAPDGVIGRGTLAALDVPPSQRLRQIQLSLARLRQPPDPGDAPLVLVDIPAFRLYAWDDAEASTRPSLEMNVVVGQADTLQTPVFFDRLRYVIFRPFWHPPRSIIVNEILPELEKDPGYLDAHDMELCPSANDVVPALPLTPENLERLRVGTARVRQRPGPTNLLGLVKFMFPNTHKVYLHDTPSRGAFWRERRDASHGCVRVQDPAALAAFVLRGEDGWTPERIAEAMNGDQTIHVDVTRSLPVWIIYLTALPRPDGEICFFDDVYGLDQAEDIAGGGAASPDGRRPDAASPAAANTTSAR